MFHLFLSRESLVCLYVNHSFVLLAIFLIIAELVLNQVLSSHWFVIVGSESAADETLLVQVDHLRLLSVLRLENVLGLLLVKILVRGVLLQGDYSFVVLINSRLWSYETRLSAGLDLKIRLSNCGGVVVGSLGVFED